MPLILSPTQVAFNARGDGSFQLPFKEQIDFFKQKINLPSAHYDDIINAAHDRAFIVAGAAKADLLTDLRNAVDKAITTGTGIKAFRKDFNAAVQKNDWKGWTGSDTAAGRDWRTRVIYQTNLSTSYAAGRYAQLTHPDLLKSRPYWKYIHSDRVAHPRPLHLSWNNTVLPLDDPWWDSHFCRNGHGCCCRITAVTGDEYQGHPALDDGTYEKKDRYGNTHVLPNGVDYGFGYTPGKNVNTPLKDMIDNKLIRFPAKIGADMMHALKPALAKESALQWNHVLEQWHKTGFLGRTAVVGAISPGILSWLNAKNIYPQTAEVTVREGLIKGTKQARHEKVGDGLTEVEWRRLPAIIDNPDQVLLDTQTGKLLYLANSTDDGIKLAVEFDYSKKGQSMNMIVSGFRQSSKTIAEKIRGGLYEEIK